jgi:hypothetical protein
MLKNWHQAADLFAEHVTQERVEYDEKQRKIAEKPEARSQGAQTSDEKSQRIQ